MKKNKINLDARVKRQFRVLKNSKLLKNVWFESKTFNWKRKIWYSFTSCLIFIIFIFPIYPSISNIVYTNTETEFDRSNIDESSILSSFDWVPDEEITEEIDHIDSYLSINTILDDNRDLEWVTEILKYEVRPWDSVASIAWEFKVSKNTILWANNMDYARELKVWEIIKVPPVTGYLYKIKSWDKIENIAREYWISVESIEKFNWIKNWYIIAWKEIILPWAAKKVPIVEKPKVVEKKVSKDVKNTNKNSSSKNSKPVVTNAKPEKSSGLVWRKPKWRFAWWNCTWYVAQYKNVNWWWNANQWIRNARAKGHSTWTTPKAWAIVQFTWGWYNPTYWHVAIVLEVTWSDIIVSDMNYRRLNEVTVRKIPINHSAIDWYIYVD